MRLIYAALALFVLVSSASAAKDSANKTSDHKPETVLVANSIDFALAQDFYGFLQNKGIPIEYVTPENFRNHEEYRTKKFVVILGGHHAPEGVGEIVSEILTNEEQISLLESNTTRKMFVKTNVWAQGQVVRILAGYEKEQTQEAHRMHRDEIADDAGGYCVEDSDCVPDECCHPKKCVNREIAPYCVDVLCTESCEGPIDCGKGVCVCDEGRCGVSHEAKTTTTLGNVECKVHHDCGEEYYGDYRCSGSKVIRTHYYPVCRGGMCMWKTNMAVVDQCGFEEVCVPGKSSCV